MTFFLLGLLYNDCGGDIMIVYWDVLFILNFFMDYISIYSTAKISGVYISQLRLIISSIIGGICGIFIFSCSFIGIIGIFISILMLYIAFLSLSSKLILIFYFNLFLLNGLGNFLNILIKDGYWINNMFYIDNNLWLTIVGGMLGTFLFIFFLRIFKRRLIKERQIKKVTISFEGRSVEVAGLLDTGNLLLDPYTGYPVILVFYEKIKDILPECLNFYLAENKDLTTNINIRYKNKIRLIPYNTAGETSVMKGFKPDYIILSDEKERMIKDVVIAVIYNKMSENNEFDAVLNPQL